MAYDITVPDGASGTLVLAANYKDGSVDGLAVSELGTDGKARSLLAPGKHRVTFRISKP